MENVRRVVTAHDANGTAIVSIDGITPHKVVRPRTGTASHLIWMGNKTPTEMSGTQDRIEGSVGVAPPPGGHIFRVVDFPPTTDEEIATFDPAFLATQIAHDEHGPDKYREPSHPFMHRTRSIDYAVVMSGEIDMKLDDSWVHLTAGDVLVQQGTNHAWVNKSGANCRIAFILIDAIDPMT
jgi:hypothetical protein